MSTERVRTSAYGQASKGTFVDRYGVWLSKRQIGRWVPSFEGLDVGDFGSGYHARFARSILPAVSTLTLSDVAIAPDLKADPKVRTIEGSLPDVLPALPDSSLDVILCISVLEHLWDPGATLSEFYRLLKPSGHCLLNVPSWRGKYFLELSAFRMGLSFPDEMDDHKMYYDPRDLWPLMVKAGFRPSRIQCFRHKFGLNTFAVCQKEGSHAVR